MLVFFFGIIAGWFLNKAIRAFVPGTSSGNAPDTPILVPPPKHAVHQGKSEYIEVFIVAEEGQRREEAIEFYSKNDRVERTADPRIIRVYPKDGKR